MLRFIVVACLFISICTSTGFRFGGSVDYSYVKTYLKNVQNDKIQIDLERTNIVFNMDYVWNETDKLVLSPAFYSLNSDEAFFMGYPQRIEYFYFEEFYLQKKIFQDLYLTTGIVNFTKGTFYEYQFNSNKTGNGLFTTMNNRPLVILLSMPVGEKSYITYGRFNIEDKFKSVFSEHYDKPPEEIDVYNVDGTEGEIFIYKHKSDKHYTELNVINSEVHNHDKKIFDNMVYSLGYSYTNEHYNTSTLYTIGSYSTTKGDNSVLSPFGGQPFSNEFAHFGKVDEDGWSLLVGYNYERFLQSIKKDMHINLEWYHIAKGYYNLSNELTNSTYAWLSYGNTFNINIGIRQNRNIMWKLRYTHFDGFKDIAKYGGSPVTGKASDMGQRIDRGGLLTLQVYLTF